MRCGPGGLLAGALAALLSTAAAAQPGGEAAFTDENIVKAAVARIGAESLQNARVNVASFHGRVVLTGEVPGEDVRAQAEKVVSGIPNVRGIDNELVIGPIIGISTRTRDSWINSDVKIRLLKNGFGQDVVRAVTEDGTVYLMGAVTRKDGAAAAEIASTTEHVGRVVLAFEYTD
jgi:osmotically-inducible protein OsmY